MFDRNLKSLIYLGIPLIAFLFLFLAPSTFAPVKSTVVEKTSGPMQFIFFPFKEFKKLLTYHRTYDEYLALAKDVQTLKARLVGLEEVMRENTRLEQLLALKRQSLYSGIVANVIGRDPSNWNSTILIDRGIEDEVAVGMPVVSGLGIVGKVAEVSRHHSKVIMLTDPSFSVIALAQRSREVGLVSGTLQGICRMRYLADEADIEVGDQVITSKLSSSFPEGLVIGQITAVQSAGKGLAPEYIVTPSVTLSQIEEVLVIHK
ncbi:MAG: rod shape-determining protein MreC [Candidatus Omnitrophica bacterium]|nr:rod shape-determining protein MreC [Candidatus Omnitrophota bacterium]